MMVLRGGLRALIYVVLGVIAYFAVSKLNIPSQDPEAQKNTLMAIWAGLFFFFMVIEGRRGLQAFSKSEMVKRDLDGTGG